MKCRRISYDDILYTCYMLIHYNISARKFLRNCLGVFYYKLFERTHSLQYCNCSGVVKVALTSYPRPKGISSSRYGAEAYINKKSLAKEDSR